MSQIPPPPPEAYDAEPPPPPPPPLATAVAGVPPWPAYAVAVRVTRPGIITAVGVVSIIVGVLSILANLYTALSLFAFSVVAPFAGAMGRGGAFGPGAGPALVAPTTTAPTAAAARSVVVGVGGMEADARRATAEGLSQLQYLSTERLEQLDVLLATAGKDIFPLRGGAASPAAIEKLVQGHGNSPSADPSVPGPDYFRTREGRVELYDDRAVFYPTRGSDIVRTSTLVTNNPGLTPQQVQTVVQQAQSASGNALNASQLTALTNLVSTEGQQFVSPLTVPTAIRGATLLPDGSVSVTFPNGVATFGPQGQSTSATGPNAVAPTVGRVRLNGAAMAVAWFGTLASAGLAVFLLVIGILTLRQSGRGRKSHMLYAVLKIPVTILGAAAAWWLAASYNEATMAAMGSAAPFVGSMGSSIGTQQVVFGVLGLIYPVALLIALQAKSVKDYYASGLVG